MHIVMLVLLMLEIIVLLLELTLEVEYPDCEMAEDSVECELLCMNNDGDFVIVEDAEVDLEEALHKSMQLFGGVMDMSPYASFSIENVGRHLLDTSTEEDETVALCSSLARVATECVREENDPVVRTEEALTIISITILCIFELELLLQLFIHRFDFLRDPLYLVDFIIVSVSLAIEAYFYSQDEEELAAGLVGLLVFGRAWRFLRIIYSLFLILHEVDESIINKHEEHHEIIEEKVRLLEEQLKQWEIEQEAASPRPPSTTSPHARLGDAVEIIGIEKEVPLHTDAKI